MVLKLNRKTTEYMRRFFLIFLLPMAGQAALQCPMDKLTPYTWGNESKDNYVHVDSDDAEMAPNTITFTGDVVAKRGQEVFYSEKINYQRQEEVVHSKEMITYGRPDFALRAVGANYSFKQTAGQFDNAEYYIKKQKAIGSAKTLKVDRKAEVEKLTDATYTTCARLNSDWFLKAKKLTLDHKNDIGIAKHVTFRIADVPVMYLPYFSFPLSDKRKTGFLIPNIGSNSSRGLELTTPYYINIAPNQDATLYPRLMTKRGFMLGAEYRYLLPELEGTVGGSYLYKDLKTKTKRWSFKTQHTYQPTDKLTITALYQRVSDKNYLDHLTDTLDLTSDKFLPSYLKGSYRWTPNYTVSAEVKEYQVADKDYTNSNKPYSLLPRISGSGQWSLDKGFSLSTNTQLTNFHKNGFVSGFRFNQKLALSYLQQNSYSFIKPTAIYRFTSYSLRDQSAGVPKRINHGIPTFSIDSGLYFDRQTSWFGRDATQVLEPRLFYLYTPYRDQSTNPDFDTALIDSSYNAMFLDNRFNGGDRIGDANQLTTAVSTTFVDNSTGQELAKFSVGQIQYFQDRKVSLTNSIANASRSNVIAEGRASINNNIKLRGLIHRNLDTSSTEKSLIGLTYTPDADKAISLSHLYDKDNYKQVDFAGVWRFNDAWRGFWRWNYSVEYDKTLDAIAGVEYADCCWGVRVMARQKRSSATSTDKPNTSVYVEFVLNGLGNVGNSTSGTLKSVIPHYRPISYERNN